jgi:hypothetical protein
VVVDKLGVVKLVPVPKEAPPVAAAYQLMVPAEALASKVTVPAPQREPSVLPVMLGVVLMLTTSPADVAEQLPPVDTVTEYVPPLVTVMDGVVSEFGLHVFPVLALEVKTELPQLLTTVIVGVAGTAFTVIANAGDTAPSPHVPVPFTVRSPEVALDEKSIVTEFPVPFIVAPVPEYAQV